MVSGRALELAPVLLRRHHRLLRGLDVARILCRGFGGLQSGKPVGWKTGESKEAKTILAWQTTRLGHGHTEKC